MKKIVALFLSFSLLCLGFGLLQAQVKKEEKKEPEKKEIAADLQAKTVGYSPAGRRDPFKDLLGRGEVDKAKPVATGVPDLSIDDVNLIGIVKARGKFTAIISSPQGFPYFVKEGEKFADGFVLSIQESQVVFRKTHDRGMRLLEPKDVIKEIYPEER